MKIEYVAKKDFKYGENKFIEKGQIFVPGGGRWDKKIMDPENGFVFVREVEETGAHVCEGCGREFSKPQGLSAHARHCKGK